MRWSYLLTTAVLTLVFAPPASATLTLGAKMIFAKPGGQNGDYLDLHVKPGGPSPRDVVLSFTAKRAGTLNWVSQGRQNDTRFDLGIAVPAGTAYGTYEFTVRGVADGVSVGVTHLFVEVGDVLDTPVFATHWAGRKLRGGIELMGYVQAAGRLRVEIRAPDGTSLDTRTYRVTRYHYHHLVVLAASSLPGAYVVKQTVAPDGIGSPNYTKTWSVRLAGPPQGYVDRQWISKVEDGRPATTITAGARALYVTFHFASLPVSDALTTTWYAPDGSSTPSVPKHGHAFVRGFLHSTAALPAGRWRCILRVHGVTVGEADVQVG